MSITATFYNFSKRRNSTQVVSGDGWETPVDLKSTTSLLRPVFLVAADSVNYNYVEYNGRYYWIEDIRSVRNGIWSVECSVDVLATYKSDILNTTAFVCYSSSDNNQLITDTRNAVEISKQIDYSVATSETGVFSPLWQSQGGIFVLATMGAINSEVVMQSFTGLYVLDSGQLSEVGKILNTEDVLQILINFFSNPLDTVVFCRWFPVGPDFAGINTANVAFGNYETNISATLLTKNYVTDILDITIPWQKNDYRKIEPFSTGNLYLAGVGSVPINLSSISGATTLSVHATVDFVNNQVHYGVFNTDSGDLVGTYSGTLGADIPISSVQTGNVGGVLSAMTGMLIAGGLGISNAVVGETSAGTIAAVTGGAIAGVSASNQQIARSSGNFAGGYSVYSGQGVLPTLTITRSLSVQEPDEYNNIIGNPCMKTREINGLTGYCQTDDFQVSGTMTETEKSEINSLMNGGVYIE